METHLWLDDATKTFRLGDIATTSASARPAWTSGEHASALHDWLNGRFSPGETEKLRKQAASVVSPLVIGIDATTRALRFHQSATIGAIYAYETLWTPAFFLFGRDVLGVPRAHMQVVADWVFSGHTTRALLGDTNLADTEIAKFISHCEAPRDPCSCCQPVRNFLLTHHPRRDTCICCTDASATPAARAAFVRSAAENMLRAIQDRQANNIAAKCDIDDAYDGHLRALLWVAHIFLFAMGASAPPYPAAAVAATDGVDAFLEDNHAAWLDAVVARVVLRDVCAQGFDDNRFKKSQQPFAYRSVQSISTHLTEWARCACYNQIGNKSSSNTDIIDRLVFRHFVLQWYAPFCDTLQRALVLGDASPKPPAAQSGETRDEEQEEKGEKEERDEHEARSGDGGMGGGEPPIIFHFVTTYERINRINRVVRSAIYRPCFEIDRHNEEEFNALLESVHANHAAAEPVRAASRTDFLRSVRAACTVGKQPISATQLDALERMLRLPLALVSGPPGAGKTTRGLKHVVEWYHQTYAPHVDILCVTPTGKAFRALSQSLASLSTTATAAAASTSSSPPQTDDDNVLAIERNLLESGVDVNAEDGADDTATFRRGRTNQESSNNNNKKPLELDVFGRSLLEPTRSSLPEAARTLHAERMALAAGDASPLRKFVYSRFFATAPPPWRVYNAAPGTTTEPRPCYSSLSGTIHRFAILADMVANDPQTRPRRKPCVVIVDEMSMVSASLFAKLLLGLRTLQDCGYWTIEKLILCGDEKQLPSIQYGCVFGNLLRSARFRDSHCAYSEIKRQSAAAHALCTFVARARSLMEHGAEYPEFALYPDEDQTEEHVVDTSVVVDATLCGDDVSSYVDENRTTLFHIDAVFPKIAAWRNKTVGEWNRAVQNVHREHLLAPHRPWCRTGTQSPPSAKRPRVTLTEDRGACGGILSTFVGGGNSKFFVGDLVIRTKNATEVTVHPTKSRRFFANGDEAFVLAILERFRGATYVEVEYSDGQRQLLEAAKFTAEFKLAFAGTIHSLQGSTVPSVLYVVDGDCVAQLFWVAISRAQQQLRILTSRESVRTKHVQPISLFCHSADAETGDCPQQSGFCAGACPECQQCVYISRKWLFGEETRIPDRVHCAACPENGRIEFFKSQSA